MALQGSFQSIDIPELFTLLLHLRKTGVLSLVNESRERGFLFCEGNLVYATSKDESKRLGSYLVRLGFLPPADLQMFFGEVRSKEECFGERLVAKGLLSPQQLRTAVKLQIIDILKDVSAWERGAFHFDETELPFEIPSSGLISTQSVMLDIARQTDERREALAHFPDPRIVFRPTRLASTADLTGEQKVIFDLVDGSRSVEQILCCCAAGVKKASIILAELHRSGIVEKRGIQVQRSFRSYVPDLSSLPISPSVPATLLSVFVSEDEEDQKRRLVNVLSKEPLLAAKLLKTLTLNNLDACRSDISLARIVSLLGLFNVRCSLLPEVARGLFFPQKQWFWKELWEHSQYCAQLARAIARKTAYPYPEEAELAGLLHNMGAFLLLHHEPRRYLRVIDDSVRLQRDLEDLEHETYGITHSKLGSKYAEKWKFSGMLQLAIKSHHNFADSSGSQLLRIVSAADAIVQESGLRIGYQGRTPQQVDELLGRLRVARSEAEDLCARIRRTSDVGFAAKDAETSQEVLETL